MQAKEDKIQFQIVDNQLTPEDFILLKVATGFMDRPLEQVKKALANDLFDVSVLHDGKVIGLTAVKGKEPFYEKLGFSCGSPGIKNLLEIER